MKAQWRSNDGPYGDATEIVNHLEHLRSQAELTPAVIVADAKNPRSPLHKYFEWNDTDAAKKYRRVQVSTLTGRLVRPNGRKVYIRVGASDASPAHFDLVTRVLRNPELRRPLARRALQQLGNWETRYADFPELREAIEALQSALNTVVRPALKQMEEASA